MLWRWCHVCLCALMERDKAGGGRPNFPHNLHHAAPQIFVPPKVFVEMAVTLVGGLVAVASSECYCAAVQAAPPVPDPPCPGGLQPPLASSQGQPWPQAEALRCGLCPAHPSSPPSLCAALLHSDKDQGMTSAYTALSLLAGRAMQVRVAACQACCS